MTSGLVRLWLVSSAAWLMAIGGWAWWEWYFDPTRRGAAAGGGSSDFDIGLRGLLPSQFVLVAIVPPLAIFAIAAAGAWVAQGFKAAR